MSKRWVKLSRGILLGTLMIVGVAQAEEPPQTSAVPQVVEAVIDEATRPEPALVAEAEESKTEELVEEEAAQTVDMF